MKKFILTLIAISNVCLSLFAQNGNHQPLANYWFPATLLTWSPATDTAAPFNRSRVPLASRFIDTLSSPCAASKNPNLKLACLTVTNANTSNNPSQGYDHAGEYAFGFWQYVDRFVMWGGSAGEGLILAPNATWIDAGHRNGVKVMGTIFLPPTAYGGQLQWVNDLIQSSGGVYPVADKLIEVANYYGFDGWFINQETAGGNSSTATAMEGFMTYFQQHKGPNMEIMWYDAMTTTGSVGWQGALNNNNLPLFQNGSTLVSNSMFLDFRWRSSTLTSSATAATNAGRSPFDLYAGIDVQANGYNTGVTWTSIFPSVNTPKVSVGLYVPSWTFHSSPDKNNIPLFYQREEKFWVGGNSNPCNIPATGWPGFAKYYIEKSVINSWPFITDFNTGQGTNGFWVGGNKLSSKQWNNQSIQDILPTWRWVSESAGTPLSVDWDFTDAYNGGNSLKVSGALSSANTTTVKLYNTQLAVTTSSNLSITYKLGTAGATNMQVAVAFTDAPTTFYYLPCGSTTGSGWESKTFNLASYTGKTLCVVGLQFASANTISNYAMNIGEIALTNATATAPSAPTGVNLTSYTDCNNAELHVFFDTAATSANVWYYDIYRVKPGGGRQWLGRTPNNAYYVKNIQRIDNENSTTIAVVATNKSGISSPAGTTTFAWPGNTANDAVSLNGTNKYISNGIVNLSGSTLTLEGWVNPNSFKSASPNISAMMGINDTAQNTALLRIGNVTVGNNRVQFALNVGGAIKTLTSASTLSAGTWTHVAGTYDGGTMTLYINGVQDTSIAASGAIKANGHFYTGRDSVASASSYLDGSLDELRAWTIARSMADIAASKCTISDTTAGIAAHWSFNDCSSSTAYDNSGNGHDGATKNMTTADWVASTILCIPNGIDAVSESLNSIRLYPNPLSKGAELTLELPETGNAEYAIYDQTGKLMQRQMTDQKQTSIHAEGFSAGIYLCRVICGSSCYTARFVVAD